MSWFRREPNKRPEWWVDAYMTRETDAQKVIVVVRNRDWDPSLPLTTAAGREVVGRCAPNDREAISGLMVKAGERAAELNGATDYINQVRVAVNSVPYA